MISPFNADRRTKLVIEQLSMLHWRRRTPSRVSSIVNGTKRSDLPFARPVYNVLLVPANPIVPSGTDAARLISAESPITTYTGGASSPGPKRHICDASWSDIASFHSTNRYLPSGTASMPAVANAAAASCCVLSVGCGTVVVDRTLCVGCGASAVERQDASNRKAATASPRAPQRVKQHMIFTHHQLLMHLLTAQIHSG